MLNEPMPGRIEEVDCAIQYLVDYRDNYQFSIYNPNCAPIRKTTKNPST